jgi:hypothetical protein
MAMYSGAEYVSTLMNSTQLTVSITFFEEYLLNFKDSVAFQRTEPS